MGEIYHGQGQTEMDKPAPEYAVSFEGKFKGMVLDEFNLASLEESMLGNDRFTHIYIETNSGNHYVISHADKGWVIADAKSNKGKQPNEFRGAYLTENDIKTGVLKVGEQFNYGNGAHTSKIQKITCINKGREYSLEALNKIPESDAKNRFMQDTRTVFFRVRTVLVDFKNLRLGRGFILQR